VANCCIVQTLEIYPSRADREPTLRNDEVGVREPILRNEKVATVSSHLTAEVRRDGVSRDDYVCRAIDRETKAGTIPLKRIAIPSDVVAGDSNIVGAQNGHTPQPIVHQSRVVYLSVTDIREHNSVGGCMNVHVANNEVDVSISHAQATIYAKRHSIMPS